MKAPDGARLLALQDVDMAYLLDGSLHVVVGSLASAVIPLRKSPEVNLDILERLRTLIDAAGDALATDQASGRRYYYDGG